MQQPNCLKLIPSNLAAAVVVSSLFRPLRMASISISGSGVMTLRGVGAYAGLQRDILKYWGSSRFRVGGF